MNKPKIVIGIDPGTITGFAVWDIGGQRFREVISLPIHKALNRVVHEHILSRENILVRWEDARKRRWFGKNSNSKQQGAGSIKRDCRIWEEFFKDYGINNEPLDPKNIKTKIDSKAFKKITKWNKLTNEHSRDAAMMIYKYK